MYWKINKRQVVETGITNKGGPTLQLLEEPKDDEHDYRTENSKEVNVRQCHFTSQESVPTQQLYQVSLPC